MSDKTAANPIAELKVSGHTMALDPGLYCVSAAPGSQAPDLATGLPVVRISAAPGPDAGNLEIAGLETEGWVRPGSATLLRVAGARTEVLVTVYQARNTTAEAPQLQVMQLSGPSAPAAAPKTRQGAAPQPQTQSPPARAPSPVASAPTSVQVVAHIYSRGDVGGQIGEWMGEPGSKRWIEGFGLAPADLIPEADIEYQAVLGRGWLSPWSDGGQFCGSRGMSLPILGLRVRLKGASATTKRVRLEATFVDGSSAGPVFSGQPCEAESLAALEAFRLVIEDASAPARKTPAAKKPAPTKAPAAKAAKPVAAPIKSTAKTPGPAKTTPAKTTPAKTAPAKTAPAKTVPTKTARAKIAPAKTAPAKTAPTAPTVTAPKPRATRTPAPRRR